MGCCAGWWADAGWFFPALSDQCQCYTADAGAKDCSQPALLAAWADDFDQCVGDRILCPDAVDAKFHDGGGDPGSDIAWRAHLAVAIGRHAQTAAGIHEAALLVATVPAQPSSIECARRHLCDVGLQPGSDLDLDDCRGQGRIARSMASAITCGYAKLFPVQYTNQ